MEKEELLGKLQSLAADSELMNRLNEMEPEAIFEMLHQEGIDVSPEELEKMLPEAKLDNESELSSDDLEKVAGGLIIGPVSLGYQLARKLLSLINKKPHHSGGGRHG